MKLTMEEADEFLVLPEDSLVTVRIEEIEMRTVTTRDGREFEKLNFTFKILDVIALGDAGDVHAFDELVGKPIYGNVSAKFTTSTENKMRQWATAILGTELGLGFELDTDLLVGQRVRALTGQYTKKGFTTPNHQIASLVPALETVGAAPVADPWASATPAAPASAPWSSEPPF